MWPKSQFPADLVKFTEEILNGKLDFLCSAAKETSEEIKTKTNTFLLVTDVDIAESVFF